MKIIGEYTTIQSITNQYLTVRDILNCCRNTRKLLSDHNADPNLLVPESNIAAIHYAAGMENTEFAEAAMKLILKCNGTMQWIRKKNKLTF